MRIPEFSLHGKHVRLEPLTLVHVPAMVAGAALNPELYRWTMVPQGTEAATAYVKTAMEWREAGTACAFATLRASDGAFLGSTRFFNVEHWAWPEGHARHGRATPDVCEIGYTWLLPSAVRTAINTEAKLLMLTHAFESWSVLRVNLTTDSRNARSRAAIERLGARFEGILRAHQMAFDYEVRHSARFSIMAEEWPEVQQRLAAMVAR